MTFLLSVVNGEKCRKKQNQHKNNTKKTSDQNITLAKKISAFLFIKYEMYFDYKLMPGKATTRNAIRLIGLIGYDEEIIRKANRMAEHYADSGVWQLF